MLLLGLSQGGARSSSVQPRAATALDTLQVIYALNVYTCTIYLFTEACGIHSSVQNAIPREHSQGMNA